MYIWFVDIRVGYCMKKCITIYWDIIIISQYIKDTASERAKFVATANDFIEGVVNRLEMAYPQNHMIDGFASLDPRSIMSIGERDEKFLKLVEHFGQPKVSSDGEVHVGPIHQPACLLQWETLKSILSDNQHMTMGEFYREFVHTHPEVLYKFERIYIFSP